MLDTGDTKMDKTLSMILRNSYPDRGANIYTHTCTHTTYTMWASSPGLYPI